MSIPYSRGALLLELDADRLGLADGHPIDRWPGRAVGNHAVQANADWRPTFAHRATPSGRPAVRFDGEDDRLFADFGVGGTLTQPTTVVVVCNGMTTDGDYAFDGRSATQRHALFRSGGNITAFAGSSVNLPISYPRPWEIHVVTFGTSASRYRRNGQVQWSGSNVGTHSITGLTIGNRYDGVGVLNPAFGGDIAEVLAYDQALPTYECSNIERYLANKYAIAL